MSKTQGNTRGVKRFSINLLMQLITSPADAAVYYFSNFATIPLNGTATAHVITIDRTCVLESIFIDSMTGTAGSNEAWALSVRVNNTTDTLIQSVSSTAAKRTWSNNALNISLSANDTIVIKSVCPTWGTNPSNLIWAGYAIFRE